MARTLRAALAIVGASLLLKLFLWGCFPNGLYHDAVKAVCAGAHFLGERTSFTINSKTWLGPLAWHLVHQGLGVFGLKLVNVLLFLALAAAQLAHGRRHYRETPLALPALLLCFYPGTNLNAVAGEADDSVAALLLVIGVLLHLSRRSVLGAAAVMGCAALFKFSAGVLALGFVGYLLARRAPRQALRAALGLALPFAVINVMDGGLSLELLHRSIGFQAGYSDWGQVAFKLLSTGLLPLWVVTCWAWRKVQSEANALALAMSSAYLGYVLIMRDAHAASFVMPPLVLLGSFPAAQLLRQGLQAMTRARARLILGGLVAGYLLLATAISVYNLGQDLDDARVGLAADRAAAAPLPESAR